MEIEQNLRNIDVVKATFAVSRQSYKTFVTATGERAMGSLLQLKPALQDGEIYAGLILGKEGQNDYHLVLLPDDAGDVSWTLACSWAGRHGGALPNCRELSLLFANLREQFQRQWYWSSEQHPTRIQLVWGENFASGIQTAYGRQYRGHARAVRRVSVDGT